MSRSAILKKMSRLRAGLAPRVMDLFSGCGGISLGFQFSGYEIVAGVELDLLAAETHHRNFHATRGEAPLASLARDITLDDPQDILGSYGPGVADAIDVIVGGPPCQAFARVGRAKLREVLDHPSAFKEDPRSNLYLRYLHYVRVLQPLAILMENVPDVMNHGGHNIPEEVCDVLASMGYEARYTLLNAVHYGVPQLRERMFLIAYARELRASIRFPHPTHWFDVPRGYEGSRSVALKHVRRGSSAGQLTLMQSSYVDPPRPTRDLAPAVTAKDALADLPPIIEHLTGHLPRGARRLDQFVAYRRGASSAYARAMRSWTGFETPGGVFDHAIRSLSDRDFEIFRRMKPGDQYPEAHRIALSLFADECARELAPRISHKSPVYQALKRRIVPPYDPSKFPNKWRKMAAAEPARTLMAHLGKDGYSHIHYDSSQARTISVREAARLMSFPDGFRFAGTMNPAFRQIGNAVPPLMALALARAMLQTLAVTIWKDESLLSA